MRLSVSGRLLIGALSLACVHCDDDDGGNGGDDGGDDGSNEPPGGSGVSGTKTIEELTDTDVEKLCAFERDVYKDSLRSEDAYCFATSVQADSCQDDLEACRATDDYESEEADDWDCSQATVDNYFSDTTGCDATIAEYEDCVLTDNELYWNHYEAASCDDPASLEEPDYTEECLDLFTKCPDLYAQ